ncbi:heat shock protein transcriptional repressor HspR [Enemella sp. A6]|uniref:heat shock protein transcriptional repressor HspR n=1 Tax=Enemella sp. A6 TaxID=3440152 RepID=UPI003EB7F307
MSAALQPVEPDAPVFTISVAARLAGMHPQTLRSYDRMGLVSPHRTRGRGRRYSPRDVNRLRLVQRLSQDEGINLEGIRRILEMADEIEELRDQVAELSAQVRSLRSVRQAGPRVFTADPAGQVGLGVRRHRPRALTAR